MIPILYRKDEVRFKSNGIGRLTEAISCTVTEERNGVYELELEYPCTGEYFNELKLGRYIFATHDSGKDGQPFIIYKISKPIDGICTYSAQHISYKLSKVTVKPFTADSVVSVMTALKENSMTYHDFQFHTAKLTEGAYEVKVPSSIRSLLGGTENSLLDRYGGGEYRFDCFDVWLYQNRGEDRGVEIRYGKNMTDFSHDEESRETYTAIAPYWEDMNGEEEAVYLPEGYLVLPNVPTFANNLATDELQDIFDDSMQTLDLDYYDVEVVPFDLSDQFDEKPTVEELREKAIENMTSLDYNPNENITFTSVETDNIRLCDTVHVIFNKIGVSASMKVIKLVWNVLEDKIESVECGEPAKTFSDIVTATVNDRIQQSPVIEGINNFTSSFTQILANGMGLFTSKEAKSEGGFAFYMHNKPLRSESKYQWTINSSGFAVSQDYGQTWTAGVDAEGNAVFNALSANIINAMEIHGAYVDGARFVFAPDSQSPVTVQGFEYDNGYGGVEFTGNGEFMVDTNTLGIVSRGRSSGKNEFYIIGQDSSGYGRNSIEATDNSLELSHFNGNEDITAWLRLNNSGFGVTVYNDEYKDRQVGFISIAKSGITITQYAYDGTTKCSIRLHPANGLGIWLDGVGQNGLKWVSDGNGHTVLGK